MSVLVTDTGFHPAELPNDTACILELGPDTDPDTLDGALDGIRLVRVTFPKSADGRGFTIARQLRRMGYRGRLRACGHVLADQYTMIRRAGFDEVEIDDALAARQPEPDWAFRADWQAPSYRTRLKARP